MRRPAERADLAQAAAPAVVADLVVAQADLKMLKAALGAVLAEAQAEPEVVLAVAQAVT